MLNNPNFFTLSERFTKIKNNYDSEHLKYIHSKTVENLLNHADSFSIKSHRDEINSTLTEYFDIIDMEKIDNSTESLELFSKYLQPLTKLYADLKGFHLVTKLWLVLLWTFILFVPLYF